MATILLVEDDEMIRNMYTTGLTKDGFTVTPVSSAGEALTVVEGQQFDIILLDMLLGGMSGIDFLESAQLQIKSPQTKVVALSNIGSDSVKERANAMGIVAFLEKADYDPIKLSQYLNTLMTTPAPAAGTTSVVPTEVPEKVDGGVLGEVPKQE
ncbi:MAG TPA: response regulator [Candidatus Saccharimonadia bacterium]|nr:response regulator [Candidatus Saccharimonadia bacterium]